MACNQLHVFKVCDLTSLWEHLHMAPPKALGPVGLCPQATTDIQISVHFLEPYACGAIRCLLSGFCRCRGYSEMHVPAASELAPPLTGFRSACCPSSVCCHN